MANYTAYHTTSEYDIPFEFDIIRQIMFSILVLLITVGNVLCLAIFRKIRYTSPKPLPITRELNKSTKLFMISLTLADFLMGIGSALPTLILFIFGSDLPADISYALCVVCGSTTSFASFASAWSLISVNIYRYLSIEFPLRSTKYITFRCAQYITIGVWVFSMASLIAYLTTLLNDAFFFLEMKMCYPFGPNLLSILNTGIWSWLSYVIIPFILTVFIYFRITCISKKHINAMVLLKNHPDNTRSNAHRFRGSNKALKTLLIVTMASVLTWLPYCVFATYKSLSNGIPSSPPIMSTEIIVYSVCTFVYWSNYWINILVYTSRDRRFRRHLIALFSSKK